MNTNRFCFIVSSTNRAGRDLATHSAFASFPEALDYANEINDGARILTVWEHIENPIFRGNHNETRAIIGA